MNIEKISRIGLREAFPHEAHNFTRWLQENLDVINGVIDITLVSAEREYAAGDFSVDLMAEDKEGNKVIIENQLERSNHDHLGKLLTYLVALQASSAIWIVSDPRPEHVSAITWLNESSSVSFYLLKLEAIRVGNSAPAPLLTLIVGPTEETKTIGRTKQEFNKRHEIRRQFWTKLLNYAKSQTQLHASISPGDWHWVSTSSGRRGLNYNYVVWEEQTGVELYIDRGKDAKVENKAIFDQLAAKKTAIESAFGGPIEWERLDAKQACRIRASLDCGGWKTPEKWDAGISQTVDAMIRLEKALRPYIKQLTIGNEKGG